jgi:hypothetical protein
MQLTILFPTMLVVVCTGCAGSMGPVIPEPPTLSVTAFDGSYRTTIKPAGSAKIVTTTDWCTTPGKVTVTVANGQLNYPVAHPNMPGNPTPVFLATMVEDGTFSGNTGGGHIIGRVSGSVIEGRIDGTGCLYTFTGDRT